MDVKQSLNGFLFCFFSCFPGLTYGGGAGDKRTEVDLKSSQRAPEGKSRGNVPLCHIFSIFKTVHVCTGDAGPTAEHLDVFLSSSDLVRLLVRNHRLLSLADRENELQAAIVRQSLGITAVCQWAGRVHAPG